MTNLFSIFDPSTNIMNLSLNWLSTFLIFLFFPYTFWIVPSRLNLIYNSILFYLHKEFKMLIGTSKINLGNSLIFISLFSLILFNNILGLFPYIFTSSSHMAFSLSLSLPLWLSFLIYSWIFNTNHTFSHLIPQGTPSVLMPFMVYIELISNVIRPGTLAIRLSANMIAGHLLMTLLGNTGSSLSLLMVNLLIITQILLLLLESAVAFIQSYVFSILATLYSTETN
uniref:ATP synthase subunit a n=1 Tax=Lachesilla anna TaxID=239245 RepID=A0A343QCG5_9NEOP|nr:ATP synthase F0 subunit 6 [Lachesilla anna]ATU07112.1 ATP synthase F0 subunit 6 [Lachesilla anna]